MIPKMTSHDLNNILDKTNERLEEVSNSVKNIKSDIIKRMKIMRYETEYIQNNIKNINLAQELPERKLTLFNNDLSKTYNQYGSTATPSFKGTPINVFNVLTTGTGKAYFRDIAEVSINGIVKEEYKDILKHDSIDNQELFFEEIAGVEPNITISISIDHTKVIGNSLFNMIEFDTFLNGSFDIEYIKIYNKENEVVSEHTGYEYAGKMRILFDDLCVFNKVEIKIVPKYSVELDGIKTYPFGLKHIYFYNAKFTLNSYIVSTIESDNYIDTVNDNIIIKTPNELIESTITNEGGELYLDYKVGSDGSIIFEQPLEPSTMQVIKSISINTKRVYVKMPIKKSLIGINYKTTSKIIN